MIEDRYIVEPASWDRDRDDLKALRTEVFVLGQNVPEDLEWDGQDEHCDHVIARDREDQVIGTGRIARDGKIGRMAVRESWRGQGVGAALLRVLLELARARQMSSVYLYAQTHALPFYARYGFEPEGEEFEEAGIPHRAMRLQLPSAEDIKRAGDGRVRFAVPAEPELLRSSSALDLLALSVRLLSSAQRAICLYTRDLDRPVYGHRDFVAALADLGTQAIPGIRIRILYHDCSRAIQEGHRLLDLALRLPSSFQLRRVHEDDRTAVSAYLVTDAGGYLFRPFGDRYEASGDGCGRAEAARLTRLFDEIWERAEPDPELRRTPL